jgi:hypothetical protein
MLPSEMLRQKKLYKATVQIDTVFVSDELAKQKDAKYFLAKEIATNGIEGSPLIEQILDSGCAPPGWKADGLIWGVEDDCTIEQFLAKERRAVEPEYQQYLALKEKFGE